MYEKELVIAAYNKPLDWLLHVPKDTKITVYRKGDEVVGSGEIFIEKNVGRCVHSFFKHIHDNYDKLSNWTYFAQDFPFDHWSNLLNCILQDSEYLEKTCAIYFKEYYGFDTLHSNATLPSNEVGLGKVLYCDKEGNPNHGGLPLVKLWDLLFACKMPEYLEFNPGGHFCASKEHLQKRSKSFYYQIVSLLENGVEEEGIAIKDVPYCIERFENYIFNERFETKL
jgi:hypothetical protein